MNAAVNFQLRYAPFIAEARKLIESGSMGKLVDVEVNVNVFTPWHQWNFLYGAERVEILYHSIHYIDLVRSLLGEPQRIYARTFDLSGKASSMAGSSEPGTATSKTI